MNILQNIDLKPYNTFGISAQTDYFTEINHPEELISLQQFLYDNSLPFLIIGEGSNLLFVEDFHGLIIHNQLKGREKLYEEKGVVFVEAYSGEVWDEFVKYCLGNGWGGMENLAYIPGTTGASAIQNIGAYGAEAKEIIHRVTAQDLLTGEEFIFNNPDCEFDYRYSVFKKQGNRTLFITKVLYKLYLRPKPEYSYGVVASELKEMHIAHPDIKDVYNAVTNIRKRKLPDVKVTGNAGSFFKNPVLENERVTELLRQYPEMPYYPLPAGKIKLAAGWLIEQCGLKGFRKGDAGVHQNQALVLVNYGNASGKDLYELSKHVTCEVFEKFGIRLEREVIVIDI